MTNYDKHTLQVNDQSNRFELEIDSEFAFIEYRLRGNMLFLIHTEVRAPRRGKGAGSAIVLKALQYAKDHNYKIVPICAFVQSYLKKHPEWNDIIAPKAGRYIHKF